MFDLSFERGKAMKTLFRAGEAVRIALIAFAALTALHAQCVQAQNADVFLSRYISGLNAAMPPGGDPAKAADLFSADAIQVHVLGEPPSGPQRSREDIRKFFAGFKGFYSDWTHVEKSRLTQGNRAVWEGVAQGHHRETGKAIRLPLVFFLDFDNDGTVREARVYVDARSIGEQLK
jgi:ketosteroid isomerase-like protein